MSGTLTIGPPPASTQGAGRKPAFVSPSTLHASVFIDGAATAAGSVSSCTAATGTGTGCTIPWTAQLNVPASHVFAVEADTGANAPADTVLSVGAETSAVVSGTANTPAPLSLNGVVKQATFSVASCSGVSPNSLCTGTVLLAASAGNAIGYTGATVVPTIGDNPSSGNVFDNGPVTFVSSAPAVGLVTGTAQPAFSTLATNILTVSGVNPTGTYTYQVTCGAAATGSFGITVGGATTPTDIVTTAELAGLSTPVTYPAAGITVMLTPPSFACASGTISSSGGNIVVN